MHVFLRLCGRSKNGIRVTTCSSWTLKRIGCYVHTCVQRSITLVWGSWRVSRHYLLSEWFRTFNLTFSSSGWYLDNIMVAVDVWKGALVCLFAAVACEFQHDKMASYYDTSNTQVYNFSASTAWKRWPQNDAHWGSFWLSSGVFSGFIPRLLLRLFSAAKVKRCTREHGLWLSATVIHSALLCCYKGLSKLVSIPQPLPVSVQINRHKDGERIRPRHERKYEQRRDPYTKKPSVSNLQCIKWTLLQTCQGLERVELIYCKICFFCDWKLDACQQIKRERSLIILDSY